MPKGSPPSWRNGPPSLRGIEPGKRYNTIRFPGGTMPKLSERQKEERLQEKLAKGEQIASADEMTEEYRENLINLMMMQADSELAGAFGYVPWIMKSPSIQETYTVSQIVKDEVRH